VLARRGGPWPHKVGGYAVDVGAVDEESEGLAHRLEEFPAEGVVVIDEVGKMELLSGGFVALVDQALRGPSSLVMTVTKARVSLAGRLLQRDGISVVDLDAVDREGVPQQILAGLGVGPGASP
jgi:nucleoside-triphosphatase THEP1